MNTDVLARIRDSADAHNIAPVISQLLEEGYSCAIVCDTPGKAHQALTNDFPHLLSITTQLETSTEMYQAYPDTKVYFGSMLLDDIGRDPFSYYKNKGSITATIQETPEWRLTGWQTCPDMIFSMPGGATKIKAAWSDFNGKVLELGMPQYEHISKIASEVDRNQVRTSLHIPEGKKVVSINMSAYYTEETISTVDRMITESTDTMFLCSIHPKASDIEKTVYRAFCSRYSHVVDCSGVPFIERLSISDFTIGSIVSTTLVSASLCGSIPVALTNPAARKELYELGGYQTPTDFPYVKNNNFITAQDSIELLNIIRTSSETITLSAPTSIRAITTILKNTLHNLTSL